MKRRTWYILGFALLVVVGLNTCARVETSREVVVVTDKNKVLIVRNYRILAMLTAEGPFPKVQDSLMIYPDNPVTKNLPMEIRVPDNADVRAEEINNGCVRLDPQRQKATVLIEPSAKYYWLGRLNGDYPLKYMP
jgi:hypothetical protein